MNRPRGRAQNLRPLDRLITGFCSLWIKPNCLFRTAIVLKPSTLKEKTRQYERLPNRAKSLMKIAEITLSYMSEAANARVSQNEDFC
jgi:hypothetical protein